MGAGHHPAEGFWGSICGREVIARPHPGSELKKGRRMKLPEDLRYHPEHTWARIEGDLATVGITDHAQSELGDVVYLELPEIGRELAFGEVFGSVESSKSISELYSPVAGEVVEVNSVLEDAPERINDDPYGEGWILRVRLTEGFDVNRLLDGSGYAAQVGDG